LVDFSNLTYYAATILLTCARRGDPGGLSGDAMC